MKRDLSFLNKEIIDRIKEWDMENKWWQCPFVYCTELHKFEHRCDYCEKIFPAIKGREKPVSTIKNCPCGHYKFSYVKHIAKNIITKEVSS